jgi:hypothetical protein
VLIVRKFLDIDGDTVLDAGEPWMPAIVFEVVVGDEQPVTLVTDASGEARLAIARCGTIARVKERTDMTGGAWVPTTVDPRYVLPVEGDNVVLYGNMAVRPPRAGGGWKAAAVRSPNRGPSRASPPEDTSPGLDSGYRPARLPH